MLWTLIIASENNQQAPSIIPRSPRCIWDSSVVGPSRELILDICSLPPVVVSVPLSNIL